MTRSSVVVQGLAPSATLAPSTTLAPAVTVYSGGTIAPHAIAMAIGATATYVDVSSYVEFGNGITYTYGRQTQFDDAGPGTFSFTLNNTDGRFTPDNPASPLLAKVTEGMGVCWQLGSRLVHGQILSVEIPTDEATWDQIVVTCDDMLGAAGRHSLTTLADELVRHEQLQLLWKLDEEEGALSGAELNRDGIGAFTLHSSNPNTTTVTPTFGVEAATGLPGTAMTLTAAPGETNWFGTQFGNTMVTTSAVTNGALAAGANGSTRFWNMWVYPGSTINLAITPRFAISAGHSDSMQIVCTPTTYTIKGGTATAVGYQLTAAEQLVPHYLSMGYKLIWQSSSSTWQLALYLYVDAVLQTSVYWNDPVNGYSIPNMLNGLSPVVVNVSVTAPAGAAGPLSGTVQRISHTNYAGLENNALYNTLDQRRAVLDFIADDISSAPYNGPLSGEPIGYPDVAGSTILDVYNDIARTESGHLFTRTTGTLLSPTEQIQVRARDRTQTVSAVFDAKLEAEGPPTFVRDITNVASQTEVTGPTDTVVVTDTTVKGRYITSGTSETVLYTAEQALREWGQDRLYRGRNIAIRTQQFTVDAVTTPTDRSADLLTLVPGDRVQLTSLPLPRLGFTAWDGWLLGGSESHTMFSNSFTFTLAPTTPAPGVLDTDRFQDDDDVILGNTVTATATALVFNTYNSTTLSSELPYTIQVDNEQMTATALTGSTLTVTRGSNGTTPASHNVNSKIRIVPTALYGY